MGQELEKNRPEVLVFHYPDEPWEAISSGWEDLTAPPGASGADLGTDIRPSSTTGSAGNRTPEHSLNGKEDPIFAAFEQGRAEGRREGQREGVAQGRAEENALSADARGREQEARSRAAAELLNGFLREQERYLHVVEHEVVQLALGVAARILRREIQMDPLLLTGAVRVALGQLSESTRVLLQVPEEDLSLWADAMRYVPNLALRPTVVAGEGMKLGECRMQTEVGSVDLGLKAQLAEIERGFFDRVGSRPATVVQQKPAVAEESQSNQQAARAAVHSEPGEIPRMSTPRVADPVVAEPDQIPTAVKAQPSASNTLGPDASGSYPSSLYAPDPGPSARRPSASRPSDAHPVDTQSALSPSRPTQSPSSQSIEAQYLEEPPTPPFAGPDLSKDAGAHLSALNLEEVLG